MLERLAILTAVWYADKSYRSGRIRMTKNELSAYRDILANTRHVLMVEVIESDNSSAFVRKVTYRLIETLDVRISQVESIISLNPLVIGVLKR